MSNKMALDALTAAQRAINSMKVEAETAGAGGDQEMLQDACEQISNEGLAASTALDAAIAALQAEPQGWIPITDAPLFVPLQDAIPPCLVWGKNLGLCMGSAGRDKFGHVYVQANGLCGDVRDLATHWMPLPATPPKD